MQARERREKLRDGFRILCDGRVVHLSELSRRYDGLVIWDIEIKSLTFCDDRSSFLEL